MHACLRACVFKSLSILVVDHQWK